MGRIALGVGLAEEHVHQSRRAGELEHLGHRPRRRSASTTAFAPRARASTPGRTRRLFAVAAVWARITIERSLVCEERFVRRSRKASATTRSRRCVDMSSGACIFKTALSDGISQRLAGRWPLRDPRRLDLRGQVPRSSATPSPAPARAVPRQTVSDFVRGNTGAVGSAGASITESFMTESRFPRVDAVGSAFVTPPRLVARVAASAAGLDPEDAVPLKLSTVMLPSFDPSAVLRPQGWSEVRAVGVEGRDRVELAEEQQVVRGLLRRQRQRGRGLYCFVTSRARHVGRNHHPEDHDHDCSLRCQKLVDR